MSIAVAIADLPGVLAARGADAYLVTVRDVRPHVVAVQVTWRDDGVLAVAPGRRTALNIADRPSVTLLWPVSDKDPKHSLLVDGTARMSADDEWLEIVPTNAVLHRAGGRRRRRETDGSRDEAAAAPEAD